VINKYLLLRRVLPRHLAAAFHVLGGGTGTESAGTGRTFTACWHDRQEEQIEPLAFTSAPFRLELFFFQLTPDTLRPGDVGQGESVRAQAGGRSRLWRERVKGERTRVCRLAHRSTRRRRLDFALFL
jgi:hypothetical protein